MAFQDGGLGWAGVMVRGATGWRMGVIALTLGALTLGCGGGLTKDIEVQAVADQKVQFSGYKSYAWLGAVGAVNDPAGLWAPKKYDVGAELKLIVDQELAERGWKESAQADVLVTLLVVADVKQLEEIKLNRAQDMAEFVVVGEGAILIELLDAQKGKTVWMGAAGGETRSDYTTEQSKKRLAYAVKQLFKLLPR
jgi:hypothetical protein